MRGDGSGYAFRNPGWLVTELVLLAGLLLLIGGGEALVHGARALAARAGLPPAVVGSTVVAIGTSVPELFVSVQAAWQGAPALAVGNVVGSNIYNLLLILGVAALLLPLRATELTRRIDARWLLGSAVAVPLVFLTGLTRLNGVLLVALLVGYLVVQVRQVSSDEPAEDAGSPLWIAPGLVAVLLGANLFVNGASALAVGWGVPPRVIGLTVVAIGTSLPELVASVGAALRGQPEMALGNVLGSNIFNVFGILGITALVSPGVVTLTLVDIAVLSVASTVVFASIQWRHGVSRALGAVLLGGAGVYTFSLA